MESSSCVLDYRKAEFLTSAATLSQCPSSVKEEVAFVGRSNVGKSSALNTLTGSKKLARTSKTPGRTQLINFFILQNHRCLVDLPGYGYAKVAHSIKKKWEQSLNDYLTHRHSLIGIVLLIDSRHLLKAFDSSMLLWTEKRGLPVHILLTKSDKLRFGAAQKTLSTIKKQVSGYTNPVSVQLYSSLKMQGVDELISCLNTWFDATIVNEEKIK